MEGEGWGGGRGEEGKLTAHDAYILFVFGKLVNCEVRPHFSEGREGVFWVCDAGVFEPREGIVVAVEVASSSELYFRDSGFGGGRIGRCAPSQLRTRQVG